jgi:hypothetical protein
MTLISHELRQAVFERAGGMCEYCGLSQVSQVATFPVDHVIPISAGGKTEGDNLALACPRCNAAKWTPHLRGRRRNRRIVSALRSAKRHLVRPFPVVCRRPDMVRSTNTCGQGDDWVVGSELAASSPNTSLACRHWFTSTRRIWAMKARLLVDNKCRRVTFR